MTKSSEKSSFVGTSQKCASQVVSTIFISGTKDNKNARVRFFKQKDQQIGEILPEINSLESCYL